MLALAAGTSFSLVDVVGVSCRKLRPVYLGDAALHAVLAGAAVRRAAGGRRKPSE